jgi:hypothetical protein
MRKISPAVLVIALLALNAFGQSRSNDPAPQYPADPMATISVELGRISRNVELMSERFQSFIDKFEKVGGVTLSEKQQRLILGLELLVRTEQRVATLQKFQIELVEKQGETRAKLAQVERDLMPTSIDRSVTFEGTTRTEEIRESRRAALLSERVSLQALMSQIQGNINETSDSLRDAEALANRLRRTFLPQIERELYNY